MKLRGLVLTLSLCGNAMLAVILVQRGTHTTPPAGYPDTPLQPTLPSNRPDATHTPEPMEIEASTGLSAFHWASLESPDYRQYMENLHAFGVPERVIRDIIISDVGKLYRPRRAALRPGSSQQNDRFWERSMFGFQPQPSKEQREQLRALQKEQSQLLKTLLGDDYQQQMAENAGHNWMEERYGSIPKDLRETVQDIMTRMSGATQDIYADSQGLIDQYTQEELRYAKRKFHDELAAILTPEQLLELELRTSDTAQQMKHELGFFEPTEEEFRAIFQNRQALEDLNPPHNPDDDPPERTPEERKALQRQTKELNDALTEALGAERADDYKLVTQWEYRQLFEAGVDKAAVRQLPDIRKDAEAAVSTLRTDASLTPEQRDAALQAVQAETQSTLDSLLGEKQAKRYSNSGGHWIRRLAPAEAQP